MSIAKKFTYGDKGSNFNFQKRLLQMYSDCCAVVDYPPVPLYRLVFIFDDIANAPVADPNEIGQWSAYYPWAVFKGVTVSGNQVTLYGEQIPILPTALFTLNDHIVTIADEGMILSSSGIIAAACNNLVTGIFLELTSAGGGAFASNPNLLVLTCPKLVTINETFLTGASSMVSLSLPELKYVIHVAAKSQAFYHMTSLQTLYIPKCEQLGNDCLDNEVFYQAGLPDPVGNTITLTVSSVLETCNAGAADDDIVSLSNDNTVTVIYV